MSLDIYFDSPKCDHCGRNDGQTSFNITHNLGGMANQLGVYMCLWCPDEIGIKTATDLIEPLTKAVRDLEERPEHFRKFDAPNGWGTYPDFYVFCQSVLKHCVEHPNDIVSVWK